MSDGWAWEHEQRHGRIVGQLLGNASTQKAIDRPELVRADHQQVDGPLISRQFLDGAAGPDFRLDTSERHFYRHGQPPRHVAPTPRRRSPVVGVPGRTDHFDAEKLGAAFGRQRPRQGEGLFASGRAVVGDQILVIGFALAR